MLQTHTNPDVTVDMGGDAGNDAAAFYRLLIRGSEPSADPFDVHVVASIFALAYWEAVAEGKPLSATTGLEPAALTETCQTLFPDAMYLFPESMATPLERGADEACLLDLLAQCTTPSEGATRVLRRRLAGMIARRAQSPNHLWQDLGLRQRGELSTLMARHFRALAARNSSDMKWKKFLYRMICRDAGYSLCTAPSCSECCDFENCFGDESGESRLARVRRTAELAVP